MNLYRTTVIIEAPSWMDARRIAEARNGRLNVKSVVAFEPRHEKKPHLRCTACPAVGGRPVRMGYNEAHVCEFCGGEVEVVE